MAKKVATQKKIVNKILTFGALPIVLPLVLLLILITIAYFQLRGVYGQYDRIVQHLRSDLKTIDNSIHRDTKEIQTNQQQVFNVTREFGMNQMEQQISYTAGDLLFRISGLPGYHFRENRIALLSLYLDKTRLPKDLLKPAVPAGTKPAGTTTPPGSPLVAPALQPKALPPPALPTAPAVAPATGKPDTKKLSFAERLALDYDQWKGSAAAVTDKALIEIMRELAPRMKLGYKEPNVFIVEHVTSTRHRILWATEQYWRSRDMIKVKELEKLREKMISARYMKDFLDFQQGKSTVKLLTRVEAPRGSSFVKAKYTFSQKEYFALLPLFGTRLSIGVKTPLAAQQLKALDEIGNSLGKVSNVFEETSHKIESVNDTTKQLYQSFSTEVKTFKRTFLLMLGLSIAFLILIFFVEYMLVKKRIERPITHMTEVAKRIHQGEFGTRCEINTEDELEELATSINEMLDRIVFLIRSDADRQRMQEDILVLLETVSQASKGDLTVRGQVVTEELQAVNDAFNHMMTSIGALVIKVRKSGVGLESTTRMLLESLKVILEKATTQASNLDIASRKIKALGDRSQEITRMVEQIGNIAMETRTLALNATLEASRAGERDTGISHLAEHVRQLAEGLEKTKQDIESFIGSIQLATNYAVDSVQDVLGLTRNTRNEAEGACHTAEMTYGEAEELGKSIALFRVKTPKDKEREVMLKGGLVNIVSAIKSIRGLVNSMDTKEFDSLNVILDDFEKDLDNFGFDEYQVLLESRSEAKEDEVPAILTGPREA